MIYDAEIQHAVGLNERELFDGALLIDTRVGEAIGGRAGDHRHGRRLGSAGAVASGSGAWASLRMPPA